MAHSPETRAAAVNAIVRGDTWATVCERHKISKATLKQWVDATPNRPTKVETQSLDFDTALKNFLGATITMLQAWATTCSDPDFIRDNPQGVNELGQTVLERADRMVSTLGEPVKPAESQ